MTIKFLFLSFLVLSCALISCDGNPEHQKSQDSLEIADTIKFTDSITEDADVSYNLPSALQIAYVFKKSGSIFFPTLLNHKSNYSKYNTTNYKRAVNFGVYSADLAYCLFNKKYQESKEYLKSCKEMGAYLGLNQAFESDNLAKRFDKNIAIEDSIVKIVSNVQLKTDAMFEHNKQNHITIIAFTGAWIESMYIAAETYSKEKNKKVLASFMEQLLLSETIIKALKSHQNAEQEIPDLISSIEKINIEYSSIASVKSSLEKDEEIDFNNISITDAEFNKITETIKVLRTRMVD